LAVRINWMVVTLR